MSLRPFLPPFLHACVRCNREEADGRFGGRLLQVKFIKRQKDAKLPLDELTVMELLDPVRRVADVKEMAGYMGIDPKKEMHLMWVAKMCVLDDLPGGWHEEATPDGTLTYVNAHTGQRTYEHPTERAFKELLERERKKRPPYQSLMPEYYCRRTRRRGTGRTGRRRGRCCGRRSSRRAGRTSTSGTSTGGSSGWTCSRTTSRWTST